MRLYFKLLLFLSFFLTLYSCEYELPGVYEPKVVKVIEPPEIQIVQLDLAEDTLFLYESKSVSFKFKSNDVQKIVGVAFYLDDNLFFAVNNDNGFFNLNYGQLSEGIHKLKVQLFVQSGSGSIADKFGSEGFILNSNKEWILKVDRFADHTYNNQIQTSNSNGYLKLSWPNANTSLFKEFHIYKNDILVKKTTINEYIDSSYSVESAYYTTKLLTKTGITIHWASGIKNEEPKSYYIIQTSKMGGFLKLSWPRTTYGKPKYEIIRAYGPIDTTMNNEYIDSSYVGESEIYYIKIITESSIPFYWAKCEKESELPKMHFTLVNNNYYVTWNKSEFYQSIDTFQLYGSGAKALKNTINPNDTIYSINDFYFGCSLTYYLKIVPKYKNLRYNYFPGTINSLDSYFTSSIEGFHGERIPSYYNFYTINEDEFIYQKYGSSLNLTRYSTSESKIVDNYVYSFLNCSNSGIYNIAVSSGGLFFSIYSICNDLIFGSTGTLINYTNHEFTDFNLTVAPDPISNIGTGILTAKSTGDLIIYDFINKTILGSSHYLRNSWYHTMSPNGDFFFCRYVNQIDSMGLFQFNKPDFKAIKKFPSSNDIKYLSFIPQESNQLVVWNGKTFFIKNCDDYSTIKEFPLVDEQLLNIDFYKREILTYTSGHLFIRDLDNGDLLNDITVRCNSSDPNQFRLLNHTILSKYGYKYKFK